MTAACARHGVRLTATLYDSARIPIRICWRPGRGHWQLSRRSISDGEIAYYIRYGPRRVTLVDLAAVAASRWAIDECFQQAKNDAGLDHHQVRDCRAHIIVPMAVLAWLVVANPRHKRGPNPTDMMIGYTIPENQTATRDLDPATRPPTRPYLGLVALRNVGATYRRRGRAGRARRVVPAG